VQKTIKKMTLDEFANDSMKTWQVEKQIKDGFGMYICDENGGNVIPIDEFVRRINKDIHYNKSTTITQHDNKLIYYIGNIVYYKY